MHSFVGWSPTITGRISFSHVGTGHKRNRTVCNLTADQSFLFGTEVRTSRDGPLPAWVMRRLNRLPDIEHVAFLEVVPGALPIAANPEAEKAAEIGAPIQMVPDDRGALEGEVIFLSLSKKADPTLVHGRLERIARLAREARGPRFDSAERLQKYREGRAAAGDLWTYLVAEFRAGRPTPAFGKARVRLSRTGQCRIDVDEAELFTTKEAKLAQRQGPGSETWQSSTGELARASALAARQVFHFLRDLSHRHYHHHQHADLLTTTFPWSLSDDETWRRETLYGLARMAIAMRRRGEARAFRQCLGIVAYAEAFQAHLCGWKEDVGGTPQKVSLTSQYDFSALRNSVEASLKTKDLEDAERRQTVLYVTTLVLTTLGLILAGLRVTPPAEPPASARSFISLWSDVTAHPLISLFSSLFIAWLVDLAFLRAAFPLLPAWSSGLRRSAEAIMGSLMWRQAGPRVSYLGALLVIGLIIVAFGAYTGFAWSFLIRSLKTAG